MRKEQKWGSRRRHRKNEGERLEAKEVILKVQGRLRFCENDYELGPNGEVCRSQRVSFEILNAIWRKFCRITERW